MGAPSMKGYPERTKPKSLALNNKRRMSHSHMCRRRFRHRKPCKKFQTIMGMPSMSRLQLKFLSSHLAIGQSSIYFGDAAIFKILTQILHGVVSLCYHHDARRIFVESMNNTWPFLITDNHVGKMIEQRVAQSPRFNSSTWMYDQANGLIDNGNLLIAINNIQRNSFCLHV
ncbi:MAG: hypothetical protein BWZ03_00729 [bacterium ADurb.BinA186]|nr:MAG: hypothetical protein BWZ03_00729 [bacterium ADurb.BinA186]